MNKVLLFFIHLYQSTRPLRPPACRFYPSCSEYACQCLERFGILRGVVLIFWRIARCQPLTQGGIDEVPEQFCFSDFFTSAKRV